MIAVSQIRTTMKKNGQQVAWFRDTQGRVRTTQGSNWVRAGQLRELADYGILLQLQQCAEGLGSDGAPMPQLKVPKQRFAGRRNGVVQFSKKSLRNLYGPGINGHMLDDIRVNFVDDKQASIAITRQSSRIKAAANERRAPWWGWSPLSVQKLAVRAAEIFQTGIADYLVSIGLMSASAVASVKAGTIRRAA